MNDDAIDRAQLFSMFVRTVISGPILDGSRSLVDASGTTEARMSRRRDVPFLGSVTTRSDSGTLDARSRCGP